MRYGLVLTGGGARAAYQAGVVRAIADLVGDRPGLDRFPFSVITGESAGAINGGSLASSRLPFRETAAKLWESWETIRAENVFRTDASWVLVNGSRWIRDLSLGGIVGSSRSVYLLDTKPLLQFLSERLSFEAVRENIKEGLLHGLGISVTNYATGTAVTFFDGATDLQPWIRTNRMGKREHLDLPHVLASAAIPIIFPPVRLKNCYYGDGSVRLKAPLSPAVHLGAERIVVIGVRHRRPEGKTLELNETAKMDSISLVDIAGTMLNAAFLDSLEEDLERITRINRTVQMIPDEKLKEHPSRLRHIPILSVLPSQDLGGLASEQIDRFPAMLRYVLRGLGASREKGWDLLSYLAFDPVYTTKLLKLGYDDLMAQKKDVLEFFS